jgi:5-methylcytosine-specific restriction endonuclease McrA
MTEVKICKKCGLEKPGKYCVPCRKAYFNTPEYKAHKSSYDKKRLLNPVIRELNIKRSKEYYSVPENKERAKERSKEYYSVPENKERAKKRNSEYRRTPERKSRLKQLYKRPEHQARIKNYREREDIKSRDISYRKEYYSRPEVKARTENYLAKEEVKLNRKRLQREYYSRPEVRARANEWYLSNAKEYYSRLDVQDRIKDYNSTPQVRERKKYWGKRFGGDNRRRTRKRGGYVDLSFSRIDIFKRDKFTCQYCKKKLTLDECREDHRIPIAKGGAHVWENLATSCQPCNSAKAAKLLNGIQISIFDKVKE